MKNAAIVLAAALWIFGLTDQLHAIETTATYLVLTGAMVAVVAFA